HTSTPALYTLSLHDALPICAGDEQVGQLGDVAHHVAVADVPAHGEGHLGGVVPELPGVDHVVDGHRRDQLVGHLDAHHGDLVREDRKSTRLNSSHVSISYAV